MKKKKKKKNVVGCNCREREKGAKVVVMSGEGGGEKHGDLGFQEKEEQQPKSIDQSGRKEWKG